MSHLQMRCTTLRRWRAHTDTVAGQRVMQQSTFMTDMTSGRLTLKGLLLQLCLPTAKEGETISLSELFALMIFSSLPELPELEWSQSNLRRLSTSLLSTMSPKTMDTT